MKPYDRVVVGNLIFRHEWPGKNPEAEPMSAEDVCREFAQATMDDNDSGQKWGESWTLEKSIFGDTPASV